MTETKRVFVCGIDWQHEEAETSVMTYHSKDALIKSRGCTDECGIVELEVSLVKWHSPQQFKSDRNMQIHNREGKEL